MARERRRGMSSASSTSFTAGMCVGSYGSVHFNTDYRTLLGEWGIPVNGQIPIARSNVAPLGAPPSEILL
jgi:hypothetical protein